MAKPIDQRDAARIRKLREAGLSVREVAKEQRVSKSTVQKILEKRN